MSWRTRIKEKIAVKREELRDIWSMGIVWLWNDLRTNARAQFRRTENWIVELRKPQDQKRFATTPPAWWSESVKAAEVPAHEETSPKDGGFAVGFDGNLIYSEPQTRAEAKGWREAQKGDEITENDYGEMLAYVPKLTNVALAKQIKPLIRRGKKDKEIAQLVGCSESYVKHYRICFERANRASNASPIVDFSVN